VSGKTARGYLVIADITGFTAFVADSELDHAQAILQQILERLIAELTPTLTLVEVEGDAVFVYGSEGRLSRGELVVELVEATYASFRRLKTDMLRNATCPCRACQSIDSLDLKFVVHFGEFVVQTLAGKTGPVGSSVNLAHRLLKTDVADDTGWRAYNLVTESALSAMALSGEGWHEIEETYEHLGPVTAFVCDLEAWHAHYLGERSVRLSDDETHVELVRDLDQPRAVVWDWLNDPVKRTRWMSGSDWMADERPGGRSGRKARNHCATYDVIEHVLDWRPFDYYTIRLVSGVIRLLATVSLQRRDGGTRLRWQIAVDSPLPRWLGGLATRFLMARRMRLASGLDEMARLMNEARASAPDESHHAAGA
jgi:hypothetical protein